MGATDLRSLAELLHKPSQSLVMTFSDDPHLGMVADALRRRPRRGVPGDRDVRQADDGSAAYGVVAGLTAT